MGKPIRVLIIEDSEDDALLLVRQLKQGDYDPVWKKVEDLQQLVAALNEGAWDMIISDHSMPHFSATKALELLKQRNLDIPVIILSGTIGEEAAVAAMKLGASDFIMKGNTARLLPAIERELRESQARRKAKQTEEQLRQAQKMEAIGRLAGGIAHDFNNLLTAIFGNCAFLIKGLEESDPKRRDVEDIKAAGERAAALTRQLLAFSRKQILEPKTLNLNTIIANMDRLLRRVIGEDVKLLSNPGTDLGKIKADLGQIEQVIMNLAVNARDAMPNGGELLIETANVDLDEAGVGALGGAKPGPYVSLSIQDTGCGMDNWVLAHLFEPFFTTKELGKGTGLGLSTVYGIVNQSAGHIKIDTAVGKGTRFSIYFPLTEETSEPTGTSNAPLKSLNGDETILVVEDDDKVRYLIRRALTAHGYRVLAACDGREALQICQEHRDDIDLMLTDVIMPQMDGGELAREILKLRPKMKVLYLSGYTDSVIAQKGILKPGIQFLQKPFLPEALAKKVREILEKN